MKVWILYYEPAYENTYIEGVYNSPDRAVEGLIKQMGSSIRQVTKNKLRQLIQDSGDGELEWRDWYIAYYNVKE